MLHNNILTILIDIHDLNFLIFDLICLNDNQDELSKIIKVRVAPNHAIFFVIVKAFFVPIQHLHMIFKN